MSQISKNFSTIFIEKKIMCKWNCTVQFMLFKDQLYNVSKSVWSDLGNREVCYPQLWIWPLLLMGTLQVILGVSFETFISILLLFINSQRIFFFYSFYIFHYSIYLVLTLKIQFRMFISIILVLSHGTWRQKRNF